MLMSERWIGTPDFRVGNPTLKQLGHSSLSEQEQSSLISKETTPIANSEDVKLNI